MLNNHMLKSGDNAIDFAAQTPDGRTLELFTQLKKAVPILLVFYKYNCPTCQFTFKYLPRIAEEAGMSHFLAVGQDELRQVADFIKTYNVNFDIVSDPKPYSMSEKYGF